MEEQKIFSHLRHFKGKVPSLEMEINDVVVENGVDCVRIDDDDNVGPYF